MCFASKPELELWQKDLTDVIETGKTGRPRASRVKPRLERKCVVTISCLATMMPGAETRSSIAVPLAWLCEDSDDGWVVLRGASQGSPDQRGLGKAAGC